MQAFTVAMKKVWRQKFCYFPGVHFLNKLPKRATIAHLRPNVPACNSKVNTSPTCWIFYTCPIYLQVSQRLDKNYTGYTLDKIECFFFFWPRRASNSKVILPEFELVQDFMHVQVICNFHKDPIKAKQAMLWTRRNTGFFGTKGQLQSPIGLEFKLFWDFMPVQVICMFKKVSIKTKQAILRKSHHVAIQGRIWCISALPICKFNEDPIKNEDAIDRTFSWYLTYSS